MTIMNLEDKYPYCLQYLTYAVSALKGVENQVALLLDQRATGSGYRQR
jgi:hypothetical protein